MTDLSFNPTNTTRQETAKQQKPLEEHVKDLLDGVRKALGGEIPDPATPSSAAIRRLVESYRPSTEKMKVEQEPGLFSDKPGQEGKPAPSLDQVARLYVKPHPDYRFEKEETATLYAGPLFRERFVRRDEPMPSYAGPSTEMGEIYQVIRNLSGKADTWESVYRIVNLLTDRERLKDGRQSSDF